MTYAIAAFRFPVAFLFNGFLFKVIYLKRSIAMAIERFTFIFLQKSPLNKELPCWGAASGRPAKISCPKPGLGQVGLGQVKLK